MCMTSRFDFDFAFLTVGDHPVDPQRGWPIPEAVLTVEDDGRAAPQRRIYIVRCPAVTLRVPTPDSIFTRTHTTQRRTGSVCPRLPALWSASPKVSNPF